MTRKRLWRRERLWGETALPLDVNLRRQLIRCYGRKAFITRKRLWRREWLWGEMALLLDVNPL